MGQNGANIMGLTMPNYFHNLMSKTGLSIWVVTLWEYWQYKIKIKAYVENCGFLQILVNAWLRM